MIVYDTATLPNFDGRYLLDAGSLSITVDGRTFSSGIDTVAQVRIFPVSLFFVESNRTASSIGEYVGVSFLSQDNSSPYFLTNDLPTASQLAGLNVRFQVGYISETGYVTGYGSLSALSVESAAVPEPAAWAMLIVGFGAVGGGLRRRRTQTSMLAA